MKKIGILTFIDTVNYGAILQATALQNFLIKKNFHVENLNYCVPHDGLNLRPFHKRFLTKIWNVFKSFLGYSLRLENTNKFISKNLILTKKIKKKEQIELYANFYDCFIVGSDQVWNPNIIGNDMNYFLKFVSSDKLKVSYAASFGVNTLSLDYSNIVKNSLKDFYAISVRENQGAKILQNLNINSEVVLDPTLLLSRKEWKNFYSQKRLIDERYILCYFMPGNREVEKKISTISEYISKKTGLKVINIGKKEYSRLNVLGNNRVTDGPEQFLNLIENCECLLTNSFHGLAFGLNFNKNVYPFVEKNLSNELSLSSRLISLLDLTNSKHRMVYPDMTLEDFDKIKEIDFEYTNNILNIHRVNSTLFLEKSLMSL
ncbi:polysaccharide pyruvyl transferase family protein [Acinetobacter indicus]|uniref:polysaccharide pyruvyl transferase family protein n=1 Tax=Acinetobacter indicus TaxID=756892 RepID=UPI000CECC5C1|nr:polysaccharide pyruvyl transferase family protein [Acinetobacter indicus]